MERSSAEERTRRQDDQQRKAFSRWVFTYLDRSTTLPESYKDKKKLETSMTGVFSDGIMLARLTEQLTGLRIQTSVKDSELFHSQNVGASLEALQHNGVELINIHTSSIVRGDEKTILGLLWQLIQHYTLGSTFLAEEEKPTKIQNDVPLVLQTPSKVPAKKKTGTMTININDVKNHIIEFINAQIAGLSAELKDKIIELTCYKNEQNQLLCTNLSSDWQTSGLLVALVISMRSSNHNESYNYLVGKFENDKNQENLLEKTMIVARDEMNIPKLFDGSDLVQSVDSNAIVTYLSYYLAMSYSTPPPHNKALATNIKPAPAPIQPIKEGNVKENQIVAAVEKSEDKFEVEPKIEPKIVEEKVEITEEREIEVKSREKQILPSKIELIQENAPSIIIQKNENQNAPLIPKNEQKNEVLSEEMQQWLILALILLFLALVLK
jgi:hypothetical protein